MADQAVIAELAAGRIRPAFELVVAGLPVSYTSVAGVNRGVTDITYVTGIVAKSISAITSEVDLLGGIGKTGPVSIQIGATDDDANSPDRVLTRVTFKGATDVTTLTTTVDAGGGGGGFDVTVDDDPTGWRTIVVAAGTKYLFYIGQEAFLGDSLKIGPPHQFLDVTRPSFSSVRQQHKVDAANAWKPRVTSHLVSWRTLPVELWMTNVYPDGTTSGSWIQYANGFIDKTPKLLSNGSVELTIVPWISVLENDIGGDEVETSLVRGYHDFTSANNVGRAFAVRQGFYPGEAFSTKARVAGVGVQANIAVDNTDQMVDVFDIQNPAVKDDTDVRRGPISVDGQKRVVCVAPPPTFFNSVTKVADGTANTYAGYSIETDVKNPSIYRDKPYFTAGSVLQWPQEWVEAFHDTYDTANSKLKTHADYLFCTIRISADGRRILTRQNNTKSAGSAYVEFSFSAPGGFWYGFNAFDSNDRRRAIISRRTAGHTSVRHFAVASKNVSEEDADQFDAGGFALGYYQFGEQVLSVRDDIYSGTPHYVIALWDDPDYSNGPTECILRVTAVGNLTHNAVTVGKNLTVEYDPRSPGPSFGDWPGRGSVRIRPLVRFSPEAGNDAPEDVVKQMLLSISGGGDNPGVTADDVQPYGYGLRGTDVDSQSLESMVYPVGFESHDFDIRSGASGEELIGPMLQIVGYALVTKLDKSGGRRRLAVVPTGVENKRNSVKNIGAGDWLAKSRVATETDDRIINRWEFKLNWDPTEEEYLLTTVYNDRDSQGEMKETQSHDMELRGIQSPGNDPVANKSLFDGAFQSKRATFAQPRRTFRAKLSFSDAVELDAGSTITVSITEGVGFDGVETITAEPMRITRIKANPVTQEAEVELVWHALNTTGWAPAMEVATVVGGGGLTVTVVQNRYTQAAHPVTGSEQRDCDFFAAGEEVSCVPIGNFAGRATVGIVSVTTATNTIVFDGAHGLVAGDTIRGDDYDSVGSSAQKALAYIADAAETLGAAGDDAYDYN